MLVNRLHIFMGFHTSACQRPRFAHTCVSVCVCVRAFVCTCEYVHVGVCVCMSVCLGVCV